MKKYLDCKEKIDENEIKKIAQSIKNGKIVVFPTETVYGIGTNGLNEKAVEKLFSIKNRPKEKPISLLVSNIEMIEKIARDISEIEYKIIKEFMPGPVTIILRKKQIIPDILTNCSEFVGIRIPDNKIARKLIEYSGVPIATTSANISGQEANVNLKDIMLEFEDKVDFYIDGGTCKIGKASTVVKVNDGKFEILREGNITREELNEL